MSEARDLGPQKSRTLERGKLTGEAEDTKRGHDFLTI